MPRPIWNGSISFGLVNVPVKLFSAVSKQDVRFHQLHEKDGVRIQQKRVCPAEDAEVSFDELVKGYEISPGQYVVIDPEELNALDPQASHTVDIEEFVDLEEIDPIFFENSYYIAPDKRAEKPYALLREAMEKTGKVAIGRFVMRTKQYLCAIRIKDGALVLNTMLFADEVNDESAIEGLTAAEQTEISDKELKMAEQLVESLAGEFKPEKYHDDYREKVLDLIKQKADGKEIVTQPEVQEAPKVVDIMDALEQSLKSAKEKRKSV